MTLTVEDGSGGDAMISASDFEAYCESMGRTVAADDDAVEAAIRRASTYISNGFSFRGLRRGGRAQIQAWPRTSVVTDEGWSVDYTSIPREVAAAVAEAALYELQSPGGLSPTVVLTDRIVSERIGPIATEYAPTGNDIGAARPVLTILSDLLAPLLASGGRNSVTARADRG